MTDNKKPTPIKTERIDNPDGTYILKHIYSEKDENFEGYLSDVEEFNIDNKTIKGKTYKNNDFTELILNFSREYNTDKSYVDKFIYTQPSEGGWLSAIEKYNKDNIHYYAEYYTDNKFKKLGLINERINFPDGSYINNKKLAKPNNYGLMSFVEKYDNNGKCYYGAYYKDKNFKNLLSQCYREYLDNGNYVDKYICPNGEIYDNSYGYYKYKSYIAEECNNLSIVKLYNTTDFTDLSVTITTTQEENNFIHKITYENDRYGKYNSKSLIAVSDNLNNKMGEIKYFKNKDFTELVEECNDNYNAEFKIKYTDDDGSNYFVDYFSIKKNYNAALRTFIYMLITFVLIIVDSYLKLPDNDIEDILLFILTCVIIIALLKQEFSVLIDEWKLNKLILNIKINNKTISIDNGKTNCEYEWKDVKDIYYTEHNLLIYITQKPVIIIPKRIFESEDEALNLCENIQRYKVNNNQ